MLGILGHDDVVERFRRALARGRLASSFLFVGPPGVGKRSFALKLAQTLLCQSRPAEKLDPCGQCPACAQVLAATHPDLELIAKPTDKSFIPLELLIGDKEHRMQEGLCHDLALRPFMGGRKIAIIDDADFLNAEGANCLLKTLEEPPPRSVLILIGTTPAKQLPTIRSRCQVIWFRPLPPELIGQLLTAEGLAADSQRIAQLALASQGSLARARELAEPDLWSLRATLYEELSTPVVDFSGIVKMVSTSVEAAGREAPARRQRLRQIMGLAADFYRWVLLVLNGQPLGGDAEVGLWIQRAVKAWAGNQAALALCLDRCLEAAEHIERNANQSTLIEFWVDQLAAAGANGNRG